MRYKEDWEQAKQRLTAFWNRDIIDRCCCSVRVLNNQAPPQLIPAGTKEEKYRQWTDPECIIKRYRNYFEHAGFAGEAFPSVFLNLGANGHAGFFKGAKCIFEDTAWFSPVLEDLEELEFDENSFLYRKTLELASALAQDSGGDYMISMPDDSGNADVLVSLLSAEELLPTMIEDPEIVQDALKKVETAYERIMKDVYGIVKDVNDGGCCIDWLGTWAPGFHAQMQSDMSVMISNAMYKEFIVPEIRTQSKFLEYPLYHLDGVEQARHLDDLLAIPELKTIQWTQVKGQKPCTAYIPELQKIQAAGKNVLIWVQPNQIPTIMENLSSRGLQMLTYVNTQDEADAVLKLVSKMTHD